jgi:carbon monoxide dehydrogenase subunit G
VAFVNRFETRNQSTGDVPAPREAIWEILRSPDALAELTPLLDDISVDGDRWCWQMSGISALGVDVAPAFTERMVFDPMESIRFSHEPPPGTVERAGADGIYTLESLDDHTTRLSIDITLHVQLPLPKVSRRAVERVMWSTMTRTGDVFARRLYQRLGVDPSLARQETVRA